MQSVKRFTALKRPPCDEAEAALLESVVAGLQEAVGVSETGREMLLRMAAGSLAVTPGTARHDFQYAVVDMLYEVLDGVANNMVCFLQEAAEELEKAKVARMESEKGV